MKKINFINIGIFMLSINVFAADAEFTIEEPILEHDQENIFEGKARLVLSKTFYDELHKNRVNILGEVTNFSPKKSPKIYSNGSPVKRKAVEKFVMENQRGQEISFRTIFFEDTAFSGGQWVYVDPLSPSTIVSFDSNQKVWKNFTENYFKNYDTDLLKSYDQKLFLASLIRFVKNFTKDNTDIIRQQYIKFRNSDKSLECRHYSTLVLPLISKILLDNRSPFTGTIQQINADEIKSNFDRNDGHVWNIIKLESKNSENGVEGDYWAVDFYNDLLADFSTEKYYKNMKSLEVNLRSKGELFKEYPLTEDKFFYPYVVISKERIMAKTATARKILYNNPRAEEILSQKQALQADRPAEEWTINVSLRPSKRIRTEK